MSGRFGGKVVLVTGGSSGISLATARLFAEGGATVFITGRRVEGLDRAVREIGGGVIGVQGDVTKRAENPRAFHFLMDTPTAGG